MSALVPTPGQTVGPFFGYALPYPHDAELVPPGSPGAIQLHGRVLDGRGEPVPDALLELWQAAPDGSVVQQPGALRRDGWTFTGWGRASTDNAGRYSFTTLAPGAAGAGPRALLRADGVRTRPARPLVHPRLPACRRLRTTTPWTGTRCWPRSRVTAAAP